jgi:hypothetical protein
MQVFAWMPADDNVMRSQIEHSKNAIGRSFLLFCYQNVNFASLQSTITLMENFTCIREILLIIRECREEIGRFLALPWLEINAAR